MPFLTMPEVSGRFAVGQLDCLWADGDKKLVVRVFYPVEKEGSEDLPKGRWLPQRFGSNSLSYAESYARFMWRPGMTAAWIGALGFLPMMYNVTSNTVRDAPLAGEDEKFPPIIFSHGLGGNRSCYSGVCVDLASHGFVVICPEHSDGSASVNVLPDKTIIEHKFIPNKPEILLPPQRIKHGFTRTMVPEKQPVKQTQYEFRNAQLRLRVAEVRFCVTCLGQINNGSNTAVLEGALTGRLDMGRLCAVGHSFGGATAIEACSEDDRFAACIAHDAWLFPLSEPTLHLSLKVPTLLLLADTFDMLWPTTGRKVLDAWVQRSRESGVEVAAVHVNGSKHQNFADFTLLAPDITQGMGIAGPNEPISVHYLIARMNADFLRTTLGMYPASAEEPKERWAPMPDITADLLVENWGEEALEKLDQPGGDLRTIGQIHDARSHFTAATIDQV
mmetsp:Transcript_616/g.1427  ORF Transcript_616/g.1427 Transcript_616/m.1427 type:complete len:446 (-) Transcript_616:46-1383(-)